MMINHENGDVESFDDFYTFLEALPEMLGE